MVKAGLFGDRPSGAVSLVEVPVSRVYARRARLAFFMVAMTVGVLTAVSVSASRSLPVALLAGLLAGVVCGLVSAVLVRLWPVLRALWHWAAEIVVVYAVVTAWSWLSEATHSTVSPAVAVLLAGAVWFVRPLRRLVVAWVWCGIVRHRLRLCFAEFIRSTARVRLGSLPLILLARPTPAGERVWVWLRPGLELADLEGRTGKLAVACWAGEVRVVRASARYAALIRVDLARRDPLTAEVASPLADPFRRPEDRDDRDGSAEPAAVPVVPLGLDLDEVPEEISDPRARRGRMAA